MTAALLLATASSLPVHRPVASLRLLPCPPSRRALLRCAAAVSELAPAASAAYGALLLGGGAFAYARSGSKGSIFGGLSGSALMGIAVRYWFYSELMETSSTNELSSKGPIWEMERNLDQPMDEEAGRLRTMYREKGHPRSYSLQKLYKT